MTPWPINPVIYEINTWVWLSELSEHYHNKIELGSIPPSEWDRIAELGIEAVWFMGVWERSPASISISNQNPGNLADFQHALGDFHWSDNIGSPYSVRRYDVDQHLGGTEGLAKARQELSKRGIRLILDFVPNHIAHDHPWVVENPEFILQGTADDLQHDPVAYVEINGKIFACGKDPYFPAWQDVLQINAFHPTLRQAVGELLLTIASLCDGVRCDMAMLLLNQVFIRTWGERGGPQPVTEYWADLIPMVKEKFPQFQFIAEAYWDLERELFDLGFDYCYDKRFYDLFAHENAENIRRYLGANPNDQKRLLRFIENHDEKRAAAVFSVQKERAAAIVMATVPGAKLFHEGQFEGRKIRLPVFLVRRPHEPVDIELQEFYMRLFKIIDLPIFHEGHWSLRKCSGWPDNLSFLNLLASVWIKDREKYLIVVNLSEVPSQGRIIEMWEDTVGKKIQLVDALTGEIFARNGDELRNDGLFVSLNPWGVHLLKIVEGGEISG